MRIGLDFDNTIVCYDELFYRLAAELSLVPSGSPMTKAQVRHHLRALGREDDWTRLQGVAYGPRILEAKPFPGVLDFISHCRRESIAVVIISHKTKHPYLGDRHDLHAAALGWLEHHGFFAAPGSLTRGDVFLELTKERKLQRIAEERCALFVDDLPEVFSDAAFPPGVQQVLFSPNITGNNASCPGVSHSIQSWAQLSSLLFQEVIS